MSTIKVFLAGEFTDNEVNAVIGGLQQIANLLPRRSIEIGGNGNALVSRIVASAKYRISEYGKQILLTDVANKVLNSGLQDNPNDIVIVISSYDLYEEGYNFVFGSAYPRYGICFDSVARYRDLSKSDQRLTIEWLIRHELGHLCGLVPTGRRHTEEKGGTHCTNYGCTMRQGWSLNEAVIRAREIRETHYFCNECLRDLG